MTATDPYRFDGGTRNFDGGTRSTDPAAPGATRDGVAGDGVTRSDVVRTALWLVLVISTVGNMAASLSGASTRIHLVCGAVTALCATVLVLRHLRGRR
ncbi:hypothetical protein [Streptomyces sp. 8P21H-1]|uniref:hypothetical protein n=1 Tax=Streptomyces sp. 8P21H-1 TaxID=2737048 RepID=UPI00156E892A|nr:hypothetical protein [Streptomyces sp. 8P21H-1]NSL42859.1 hypothetical protein [Streptomyces sp. 8P21H-1]